MPTYLFKNKTTGEETEMFLSISDMEQLINGAPMIGYSTVTQKPDSGFRDVLKEMKKKHRRSTINTW